MKEYFVNPSNDIDDLPEGHHEQLQKKKIEKYRKLFLSRAEFKLRTVKKAQENYEAEESDNFSPPPPSDSLTYSDFVNFEAEEF